MQATKGRYRITGVHEDPPRQRLTVWRNTFEAALHTFRLACECGYQPVYLDEVKADGNVVQRAWW